ncbi:MAG TPA: Ig-like domain-containing protein [Actinotalea sp.]|nr:Ig-like domain-containing protein [Actinotalea sp.]
MRVTKSLAALASGALLAGMALVAVAAPASANDESPVLAGGIYWFATAGPLASQSAATQITSGSLTARPWVTLTTENACPAGTNNLQSYVRIPQAGVAEELWDQVPMGAPATAQDADGRFYTTTTLQADRMQKPQILAYNLANGGSGTFPFISVCKDIAGTTLASFRTTVAVSGTTSTDIAWTIASPAYTGGGATAVATTTTLATPTVSGTDLTLSATVAPGAAAGTVTFLDGATTLGTAPVTGGTATYTYAPAIGAHSYSATFTPTDAAAYAASTSSAVDVTLGTATSGELTLVLGVPGQPLGEPGTLLLTLPAVPQVQLTGARDSGNTRVTAGAPLPALTVTETRRDDLLTGWEVSVQASDFTGTAGTVSAKYLGWTPATPVITPDAGSPLMVQAGGAVASALDVPASLGLSSSQTLGRSTASGRGVTSLAAALAMAIPAATAEGTYTSTVTVTLVAG